MLFFYRLVIIRLNLFLTGFSSVLQMQHYVTIKDNEQSNLIISSFWNQDSLKSSWDKILN